MADSVPPKGKPAARAAGKGPAAKAEGPKTDATTQATETKPAAASAAAGEGPAALKKGALVRLNLASYRGSLEAAASDPQPPAYVLEGPGEILLVKGEHAQVRWRRPVPDVWLKLSQLEPFPL